jgi:hypothetical protein
MNRWRRWVGGVALIALAGAGCEHSCTDIGCGSGVSATLTRESGSWEEGEYTLDLAIDGRDEQCVLQLPDDAGRSASCGGGVRVELATTTMRVLVADAPKALSITLSRDGGELLSDSPTLTYGESEPNGPDCGVCRSAHVDLTVADQAR